MTEFPITCDGGIISDTPVTESKPTGSSGDNRRRCEDGIMHCEWNADETNLVCLDDQGHTNHEFHDAFCLSDPNRPYADYRLHFTCSDCGRSWDEFYCEDCVIEGPAHWGYWPDNHIPCPSCKRDSVPLPVVVRI